MKIQRFVIATLFIVVFSPAIFRVENNGGQFLWNYIATNPAGEVDLWYVQYLALLFCLNVFIAYLISSLNKPLAILSFLCSVSAVFTCNQHIRSILCLSQFNLCLLMVYFISKVNVEQRRSIFRALIILGLIQIIWTAMQSMNIDPIFKSLRTEDLSIKDTVGFSGSRNQIALFMSMVNPFLLSIHPAFIILPLYILLFAKTTIAFLAFTFSSFVYFLLNDKSKLKFFIPLALIAGLLFFSKFESIDKTMVSERFNVMSHAVNSVLKGSIYVPTNKKTLMVVEADPMMGFGLGSYTLVGPYSQNLYLKLIHRFEHVHNDYIQTLFEIGVWGFLALIASIGMFFYQFIKSVKTKELNVYFCSILAWLVCACAIYTVQTAVSGILIVVVLGLFYSIIKEQENGETSRLV